LGGVAFAVFVAVGWLDLTSLAKHVWFSFVGAVAVTVAVYLMFIGGVGRGSATPVRLTLAGVALGAKTKACASLRLAAFLGPAMRRARPRRQTNQRPSRISSHPDSLFTSGQARMRAGRYRTGGNAWPAHTVEAAARSEPVTPLLRQGVTRSLARLDRRRPVCRDGLCSCP